MMSCPFPGREVDPPFHPTHEQREVLSSRNTSFVRGRSGTGKTTVLTQKLIEDERCFLHPSRSRNAENGVCRQLFVTVSPRLCDAVKDRISLSRENSLADATPETFVNIQECYPLVIPFKKFLMMMDLTLGNSFLSQFEARDDLQEYSNAHEVTYEKFCCDYWDSFPSEITKKFDPSRVFTEITSHIKGGLQAGGSNDGVLTKEGYYSLAGSRYSSLSRWEREPVYKLFQAYENRKTERGEYDLGDFVNDIHRRLKNDNYKGEVMDRVYIDEVEDLTMKQILLFKCICDDFDHGFMFAGDTAETISRVIDFRFQDIRSLFYKEFLGTQTTGKHISEIKQLKQNFRTHAGVLDLAQSVIDVLNEYFPHTMDKFEPETSLLTGEAPVLLESASDENPVKTIFGDIVTSGKMVGFGAHQAILVRDDQEKKEVRKYVGEKALVLTILECKGLEFQDVLLYNFFGTSPLQEKWRVLYGYMKISNLLDENLNGSVQTFNKEKHNVLCSELKQLYVAITRAKQRLWICESNEHLSTPMFDYWKTKGLVQVMKVDDSLAEAMKDASSSEEWLARGEQFFNDKNYVMALRCFERAGDAEWGKLAKAYSFKVSADQIRRTTNVKAIKRYLTEAATLFESIGDFESAASCYSDSGDYEKAGDMYMSMCGKSDAAARCYRQARCYSKAAKAYAEGNDLNQCLSACGEGQIFDEGLLYVETWKEDCGVEGEELIQIKQKFLETCSTYFHSHADSKSMMKFVRAFCSMEFKRQFLKSVGCLDELLEVEEESGNFCEALELASSWGDIVKEAELSEKAGDLNAATYNLCWHVILSSLWEHGKRGWPLKPFVKMEELCEKAISLAARISEEKCNDVCRLLKAVRCDQHSSYSELHASEHATLMEHFFSIRKILEHLFITHVSEYSWADETNEDIWEKKVVLESVVSQWYIWKAEIMNILESFEKSDKDKNTYFKLNLQYLGIRAQVSEGRIVYVILKKDAEWLRNCRLHSDGRRVSCNGQELASAMRSYWESEMYYVGIKVLETLKALEESQSKGPTHHKSKCILYIFDISSSLLNDLNLTPSYEKKLESFRSNCTSYLDIMFPLDWRNATSKELTALRKTDLSGILLRWIMKESIYIKGLTKLTTGKVLMLTLEEGLPEECLKIINKHKSNQKLKTFFESIESNFHETLACALALENNLADTMSPHHFLYSLDYLITTQLMCSGVFFTTRSSFVRYVIGFINNLPVRGRGLSGGTTDLIGEIVRKIFKDKRSTELWIRKSDIDSPLGYHRILVLKMIMIFLLMTLNGGLVKKDGGLVEIDGGSRDFRKMIVGLLKGIGDMLPESFSNLLKGRKCLLSPKVISEAFSSVNDPLVILCSGDISIDAPYAIIVDPSKPEDEIMDLLFSRNTENVAHESGTSHVEEKINDLPVKDIQTDGSRKGKKGKNSGKGKKK